MLQIFAPIFVPAYPLRRYDIKISKLFKGPVNERYSTSISHVSAFLARILLLDSMEL